MRHLYEKESKNIDKSMPEIHKKYVLSVYRRHCKKIKGLKRKKYLLKYILASKVIYK